MAPSIPSPKPTQLTLSRSPYLDIELLAGRWLAEVNNGSGIAAECLRSSRRRSEFSGEIHATVSTVTRAVCLTAQTPPPSSITM